MNSNQKQFLYRLYFVTFVLIVFGAGIAYKIFDIQYINGEKYRSLAKEKSVQNFNIIPKRGNIYSDDGSVLAFSTTSYDIYFDAVTVKEKVFSKKINQLSYELSKSLGKTQNNYKNSLIKAKKQKKRYHLIVKDISLHKLKEIKNMPLFKLGGIKGGLIIEKNISRQYPLNRIAERTIGYEKKNQENNYYGVGLEHAFGEILRGKDGSQLMQKISNGKWKPLINSTQIQPKPGKNIHTNINIDLQDIAHHSLLKQLEDFEADHGSVVIMETKTGAIKAISNLARTTQGKYYERLNYAVGESHEPGSTFKLMSMIAALEDGVIKPSSMIDTKNGELIFYGNKVRDSKEGGYGKISASEVFKFSSNTGIVDIVTSGYSEHPEKFSERLFNMGINQSLGISIKGEGKPKIPHPNDKNWNGLSLPWMAYGYGVSLTPMQILSFYNAIANNGELLKPLFVKKNGVDKVVLNPSICSKETLAFMKDMLEGVVNEKGGTAYNIKTEKYKIAGKTGTCQVDYNTKNIEYISTFVGYFPADKPKYSCIVVIHRPNKKKGYYGNVVAAPVFKTISDKIFSSIPQLESIVKFDQIKDIQNDSNSALMEIINDDFQKIKGKSFYEILPILENLGYRVDHIGEGLNVKDFKVEKPTKNKKIIIELS
mgnify:CR=1 FL=1